MATHEITVNFRNCDHWHWSLNGGADSMVMTGNTAEIDAPNGGELTVKGVDANHVVLATDTTLIGEAPPMSVRPLTISEYITAKLGYEGWTIDSMVTWDNVTKTSATAGYSLDAYARTGVPGREIPMYIYPPSLRATVSMVLLLVTSGTPSCMEVHKLHSEWHFWTNKVDQYFPMFEGTPNRIKPQ